MTFTLTSPSFRHGAAIPAQHTCEGADTLPALAWTGAPDGTKSFVLVVDDPDAPDPQAPKRVWVHAVITGLPASTTSLPEGGALPAGAAFGANDWGKRAWGGPCPPIGRHRYFFKLYALDVDVAAPGTKAEVLRAIEGHVLAQTELMGTYEKAAR